MLEMLDELIECFIDVENIDKHLEKLKKYSHQINATTLERFKYLDPENISTNKILTYLSNIKNQEEPKPTCKHRWIPAGHKKNKDRVHNKNNGRGKYMAYKCEICNKFKRRYFK